MSLIKDVRSILNSCGFTSYPIYLSYLPDESNVLALYQTGGMARNDASGLDEPTFQIRARHDDYEEGVKLLEDIKKALVELKETVLEPNRYVAFYGTSDVMELGRDEQERFNFSINFRTYVERNFYGYAFHLKQAQDAVVQAESSRLQSDIDSAYANIELLPHEKQDYVDLKARLDNLVDYLNRLQEATHLTEVAEASKIQADVDNAKTKVDALENETDRKPLQDRLAVVQAWIRESTRVCVDFGSPQYMSPAPWNNLTGVKVGSDGSKVTNLMAMSGSITPYSIEVINSFDSYDVTGMEQDGIYFEDVIRDYFCQPYGTDKAQLKISGLDPTKFYRVTCFGSRADANRVSEYLIKNVPDNFIYQTVQLDCSYNLDKTVAVTLQPSPAGEIFIRVGNYQVQGWAYLNALEIQQV